MENQNIRETEDESAELQALLEEIDLINPVPTTGAAESSHTDKATTVKAKDEIIPSSDLGLSQTNNGGDVLLDIFPKGQDEYSNDENSGAIDQWILLPIPLFQETFTLQQWTENSRRIKNHESLNWVDLVLLSRIKDFQSGERARLLLVMVREVFCSTFNDAIGIVLSDESNVEISATIHPDILFHFAIKAHFGMTLILQHALIFKANPLDEPHLIITKSSIVKIFANVHSLG